MFIVIILIAGFINSMCGIGTGNITIPFLSRYYPLNTAKGTALISAIFAYSAGTLSYIINGWGLIGLPPYSLGYVYLPAFFAVAIGAIITTPVGSSLSRRFELKWLCYVLLGFVLIAAVNIIIHAFIKG